MYNYYVTHALFFNELGKSKPEKEKIIITTSPLRDGDPDWESSYFVEPILHYCLGKYRSFESAIEVIMGNFSNLYPESINIIDSQINDTVFEFLICRNSFVPVDDFPRLFKHHKLNITPEYSNDDLFEIYREIAFSIHSDSNTFLPPFFYDYLIHKRDEKIQ